MNQKGAALAYTILAVAVTSSVVGLLTTMMQRQQKEQRIHDRQLARDAIGRRITEYMTNPLFILESIEDIPSGISWNGNQMLRNCLGAPFTTTATVDPASGQISGTRCNMDGIDPNVGHQFILIPEDSYVHGDAEGNNINCANPNVPINTRSVSCFIAGTRGSETVSYNFDGDTRSSSNVDFPLTARVFFRPVCQYDSDQTACEFAEAIELRYEITQATDVPGEFRLGTYPINPTWTRVDTLKIVGMTCNTGALATLNDTTGRLDCVCSRPYSPLLDPITERPIVNSRGPVCRQLSTVCPQGMIFVGHDANFLPKCQPVINSSTTTTGPSYTTRSPSTHYSCNTNNNGGWVSNIERNCSVQYNLRYQECPKGCGSELAGVIAGAIVGFITAFLIALHFIPFGSFLWFLAMGVSSIVGAAAGYVLGTNWDWIYVDNKYGQYPYVECDVQLECSQME